MLCDIDICQRAALSACHEISKLLWPIAMKLYHIVGIYWYVRVIILSTKFGALHQ